MSLEITIKFNEKICEIREKSKALMEERASLHGALEKNVITQAALQRDLEYECAEYINQFDRNQDGNVTPMEILKSLFCSLSPSEDIIKAMFTADENGNAIVSLDDFTYAIQSKVLDISVKN